MKILELKITISETKPRFNIKLDKAAEKIHRLQDILEKIIQKRAKQI